MSACNIVYGIIGLSMLASMAFVMFAAFGHIIIAGAVIIFILYMLSE